MAMQYAVEESLLAQMEIVFESPGNVMGTMTVETCQMNRVAEQLLQPLEPLPGILPLKRTDGQTEV